MLMTSDRPAPIEPNQPSAGYGHEMHPGGDQRGFETSNGGHVVGLSEGASEKGLMGAGGHSSIGGSFHRLPGKRKRDGSEFGLEADGIEKLLAAGGFRHVVDGEAGAMEGNFEEPFGQTANDGSRIDGRAAIQGGTGTSGWDGKNPRNGVANGDDNPLR